MPRASQPGTSPQDGAPPENFEAAVAELEALVASLEGGQLPLAEALSAYRRGARLLQFAQGQLQDAQEQVRILEGEMLRNLADSGVDAPGQPGGR